MPFELELFTVTVGGTLTLPLGRVVLIFVGTTGLVIFEILRVMLSHGSVMFIVGSDGTVLLLFTI